MARTLFDIYRNTETANATATQSKPRTLFDIYGKQGAENVQNYQSSQVDTDYNKSGLLGGIGYTLGKFGTGAFSILEGIWDYTAGGIADLFGADEWAEEQFANNVTANWNQDLDEWYNPSKVMRGVGDVASGVGNTLAGVGIGTIVSVASGGTLAPAVIGGIAMGVGAAGMATSEAYAKTGKLGLKEYGYGALVGATEGALETVSGVTGKYAGKLASKMLAKNTAKTVAKNTIVKSIAKDIFNDFKGEFIEEAVSEFITPVYQRWTQVDPNAEYATIQQIGYAGLIGGISGAIMGGVSNGVSAIGMARRGNEIAKSPEHVNSVVNMASRFADYEAQNNTGDEAYQYLSQALNDYKARDNGTGILTPGQKQDLAKMERASVILMYSDNVKASKQKIVDNADAFADYINSRNMVDENGNAIRYANGAELLKDDRTVTQFAVADMLGDMLMPTENMYGTVLQQNTNALREEDFANFQKKATPQQKKSINELLGVEVDNITYADFSKAIQNADKTKLADVETGIRARASSKRVLTKAKTQGEKLYDYNENVAIGESPVAFKSNDKEYVITKAKDGFYLYYEGNISRKLTQAELNDAVNEIKNPTVKPNTETESTKTTEKTPQKQAKAEESVNAPTETKSQEKATAKSTKEDNTIKGKRTKKNGVTYIGFNPKDVSRPIHKASMRGAEVLAKASNLEIFMYASKRNADGKLVIELNGKEIPAPNGMFSDGNKIYLDINAGMAQEGTTLFTMSHEVTHYIKKWNEQGYNELADFLFNNYKGITPVESLIKREMSELKAQYQAEGKTLPSEEQLREIAKEEVVANAMSKMLADESSWTKLAELKKQNQTLWEKIGEAISKFLDRLKKAIGVYKGYSLDARNSAMTKDMSEEVYNKLQDLYVKAFVDADANFGSQDLINREASTEVVAVEDVTKGSYRSLAEACGFVAQEYEDGTRAFVRDGEKVKEITKEDIENSPVGAFINYSLEMGDITEKQADAQKELFVDICNLANETNDFAMTMQFVGSSVFTAMKANADKQYGTTYDFPSICTKTQAVIDAMSAKMVALKRGLTKKEVLELYNEVWNSGNPVPCPECYVFSRWIGIGGLLDNINKYQNFYGEMSPTEVENAYQEMYKDIEKVAQEKGLAFGKAKAKLVSSITKEYNKLTEKIEKDKNQGQVVKAEDEKKLADLEPLMVTVKAMTWIDTVYFSNASHTKVNANYKVPTDILFDLNKGEIFASKYKEAWKFRTNQGAGYGKAITPYAEAVLGEGVLATNNTTKTITDKANGKLNNIFLDQKGKMTKEAKDKLAKARAKQKNQAFIGMQRFQSTSDARYENASDYLLAMLEMQAMGGGVQVYTKVDGAVPAFATWNCFINQSLMPIGGGLDASGNLADSKTGGMNPKIAFENRAKYETAGTITIGVNDKHIRALYTDVNRDFVIPYHASGGDSNLIAEFRTIQDRNEARNTGVHSTDYSRMQGEKILSDEVLKWQGKTDAEIQTIKDNREARIAILTRGKPNMEVVRNNSFLSELYDKLNGGEWNGVKLAKDKFESQIYPNEYWDKSVGYDRSGVNSQRYLDYCESLGFLHKFSGKVPHRGVLISVKGYDEKGEKVTLTDLAYKYDESGNMTDTIEDFYWKNLVDHRMYGNDGKYLEQRPVKLTNTTTETVTTFAKNNYGRQYNKEVSQATAKRLAEEATMYSTRDSDGNVLTAEQQEFFKDSKVRDKNGRLLTVYHGSPNVFTEFSHRFMNTNGNAHGRGFYFTDDMEYADGFKKDGGQLLKGYLDIRKPASETKVTIRKAELVKLIKATCEAQAQEFMDEESYDNIDDALLDTWVSNYVDTYSAYSMDSVYRQVAESVFNSCDNDVDMLAELTNGGAGTARVLSLARKTIGYDGIIFDNGNGTYQFVSFESNQFKNADNTNPTENADIRYSTRGNISANTSKTVAKNQPTSYNKRTTYIQWKSDALAWANTKTTKIGDMNSGADENYYYFYEAVDNYGEQKSNDYRLVVKVHSSNQELINELNAEVIRNNERNHAKRGDEGVFGSANVYWSTISQQMRNNTNVFWGYTEDERLGKLDRKEYHRNGKRSYKKSGGNLQRRQRNEIVNGKGLTALDKDYLALIKYGYLESAERMVREQAEKAGFAVKGYHGSRHIFTAFDRSKLGSNTNTETSKRWFFASDKETANSYYPLGVMEEIFKEHPDWGWAKPENVKQKGKLYSLFIKMDNPLIVDVADYDYASHRVNKDAWMEFVEQAEVNGNDGIILLNAMDNQLKPSARESTVYMFKNPSQAKSADVITYDDDGNIIPLSQRFNFKNDDIRYSTRPAIKGEDKVMTALPSDKISVKDVITGNATVKDLANQAKSGLAEKTEAMRVLSTNAQATLERVMKEQGIADAEAQVNYVRAGRYASFNAIEKEGGQYNLLGNKRVGMSLGKILEPIYNADKKDGKTYADFELYLLHWHNIERYEAGKPVFNEWKDPTEEHVTSEDSRKAIEELDKIYPDFYKIAERVWRFNDNNLQLCVDSGMWSQEYADELREMYPHYVPTMREEYNTKVSAIMGKNNVSINNAKKKAVGSSAKILPIDDMISAQTIQKTTASRLNNLLVQMLEKGNHAEFEVIGTEDADLLEAYEGVSDMVTFFKDKGKKEHQVTFFYNGKKVTAKVSNLVYEGLNDFQGSAGIQDNLILASVAKVNKGFKKLVTSVNPFFSFIRNPVRDMQDALLYTKYTPWQFLRNYKRAQNEIRTNGKYWQEAKSAGIASSSVYDYETGIEYRQKGLKANWKRLLNKLENVSQTIEMSPRLSEYISAREAGLSVEDALLQAQDVTTNFGRGGVFAKKLNSTISPFLNPSIQGFSKMFRAYTGKDGAKQWIALIIKSLILGVGVSALNDLINDDEEEYNDLSDYVKEQNYVIALGNGDFIKIPKGRVFSVFGSAFLRGKRYASGETNAFDDYLKSVASAVTPIDSVARTIISPFQDIATNTTWYGGAIEGQKWNDTAPKNRYDASTSKISIWLGEVFDYSPIKIDYLLDQYSGIVGDLVLPMTSTEAESGIVTKNLIANSITNSRWSTQFYDTLDEYTYKKTAGDLQAKAVVRYMNNVSKTISDMYKQKSEIQADTKKSDKDKLKETKILQATINTLMKETLGNVKEMYDAFGKVDLSTDEAFDKAYYDSIKYFISAEQAFKVIGKDTYEKATKMTKLGVDYDSYYDYYYGLKGIESDRKADGTVINGSKKAKIIKYTKEQNLPIVQQLILIMSQGYTIADGDIKGVTAKTAKTKVAKYIASLNATAKEKTELAEMLGFTVKNGKIQLK